MSIFNFGKKTKHVEHSQFSAAHLKLLRERLEFLQCTERYYRSLCNHANNPIERQNASQRLDAYQQHIWPEVNALTIQIQYLERRLEDERQQKG